MRILYVNTIGYVYGGERSLLGLMENSTDELLKFLMCPENSPLADMASKFNAKIIDWKYGRIRVWQLFKFISSIFFIRKILKSNSIDVIHANSLQAAVHVALAARITRIPLVSTIRDIGEISSVSKWMLNQSDIITANSRATASHLIDMGLDEHKIHVVYNGFDFPEEDANSHYNQPEADGGRILFVGQLIPRKGVDILLKAFANLLLTRPRAILTLIGDDTKNNGHYKREYSLMAEQLGITNSLDFRGYMEIVQEDYLKHDVLVAPSRVEPFGRVLVEALGSGLPVVASRVDGIPEIIQDAASGILVEPEDIDGFSEGINRILEAGGRKSQFAEVGKEYVLSKFSMENQVQSYMKLYQRFA